MGNPFEDLRQAVVVRPMNSPGPQGAEAPEMKIQYSNDGSSWHNDPVDTDRYLRFSTDNGMSWSSAIYFNNLAETLEWVEKARQWAVNPENVAVEDDQYSALHHALRAARSESNAEAAALDAAESAAEAFGAAAPAWDSETIYNYNDVVSFNNGHTYRCIGTNVVGENHAPNINGVDNEADWTRITVSPDGYFEVDENGDLMPMITPITSEIFMLDENGDIMYQSELPPPSYSGGIKKYVVATIADLLTIHDQENKDIVFVENYHTQSGGGGTFYWDRNEDKANHDGGTIIDPDRPFPIDWNDIDQKNVWFTPGSGIGCWKRIFEGAANVKYFGAKGDGITDDTISIQKTIDHYDDIYIPFGIYIVNKSTTLNYPDNSEPCIGIVNRDGVTLGGTGKLKCNVHAQGILEVNNSTNVKVYGITLEGAGNFPPLDGTTGRGEKGTPDAGYSTQSIWGFYKNNCLDTSNYTGVNGDSEAVFGTWNGGYIGNISCGVFVCNGSQNVRINNVTSFNFNYAGICIGYHRDTIFTDRVFVDSCTLYNNYECGINIRKAKHIVISNCNIHNVGHPNANPDLDDAIDPGYGICTTSTLLWPTDITISHNKIIDCIRKGIDAHGVIGYVITNNSIMNCYKGVEIVEFSSPYYNQECIISNNYIKNCGIRSKKIGNAIFHWLHTNDNISIINCEGNVLVDNVTNEGIIRFQSFDQVNICNNVIRNIVSDNISSGIVLGEAGSTKPARNIIFQGNNVKGNITTGINIANVTNGIFTNNIIDNPMSTGGAAFSTSNCKDTIILNNIVKGFTREIYP